MSEQQESGAPPRLTPIQWLICVMAAIGFAFDTYEILMAQFILRPSLIQLGHLTPGTPEFTHWRSLMFYVPAVCGGLFGLLGGYLTDLFGRRRVLVASILIFAVSAFASGFSTSLEMLLVLRSATIIGVCVEFVAAVAWLAELFHHPKQKEAVLGWTQAAGSLGGVLVTSMYYVCVRGAEGFPAVAGGHEPWRYVLISGLIPALPLILIRPFLPDSPDWEERKKAGTLRRPSIAELFQPQFARTTIVATIIMACGYGAAFGAIQQIPGIVPDMPQAVDQKRQIVASEMSELRALPGPDRAAVSRQLKDILTKPKPQQGPAFRAIPQLASLPAEQVDAMVAKLPKLGTDIREKNETLVSGASGMQETGGLVGRILLALLALYIASRRTLLRIFQIPGLIVVPLVFFLWGSKDYTLFRYGVFFAGLFTVAQFSFWGNYLPRMYPIHLRGTGESFAANIGGRMIGTGAAFLTSTLSLSVAGESDGARLARAASMVALGVYLVGVIASFWLPEPKEANLAE